MENNKLRADCEQGKLVGTEEKGTLAFYDIPYGADKGRFMKVGEPLKWNGIRDATKPGPIFPQLNNRLASVMGTKKEEHNQSEDAFRLNIWTKGTDEKRPVVFWIHGGGFLTGGGSLPWYNGSQLAANGDVVVVTVNYRLGTLGNLFLPGISEGNLALKDLIAALYWVRKNIECFGGDPDQITVAGQSAGAWYSVALMACEEVKGMFNRTALFSLPGGVNPLNKNESIELSHLILENLSIDERDKDKLVDVPVEQILAAQGEVAKEIQRRTQELIPTTFFPIIDGILLKGNIISEAVRISGSKVNVMAGLTAEENAAFLHHTSLKHEDNYLEIVESSSNALFKFPTYDLMTDLNDVDSNTYVFNFNYQSPKPYILACHCMDLPFVFGNFDKWENAPMLEGVNREEAQSLSNQIQEYFLSFIKNGTPNHENSLDWPIFERKEQKAMIFDKNLEVKK
ncbi:carboxylesterase family protein [Paenibacillus farraposensis]